MKAAKFLYTVFCATVILIGCSTGNTPLVSRDGYGVVDAVSNPTILLDKAAYRMVVLNGWYSLIEADMRTNKILSNKRDYEFLLGDDDDRTDSDDQTMTLYTKNELKIA